MTDRRTLESVAARQSGRVEEPGGGVIDGIVICAADVQPEPVTWLWQRRIPLGKLTLLSGDPGLGKSTLLLDLAARVSKETPMPDGSLPVQGGVVVLSAEDGAADTIVPRLNAAGADLKRIALLAGVRVDGRDEELILPDHLEAVRQAVSRYQALLVVVDPLNAYLTGAVNSWRDHDLRRALRPLAKLAEDTGVALIASRHLRKASGGPALYAGGGSIAFTAAARAEFLVARDPDDDERRVLAIVKSNLAAPQPSLTFRLESTPEAVARIVWGSASPYTANQLVTTIRDTDEQGAVAEAAEFLSEHLADGPKPSVWVEAAAEKVGIKQRTLDRARRLLAVGKRKRGGRGGHWEMFLLEAEAAGTPSSEVDGVGTLGRVERQSVTSTEERQDRQLRQTSPVAELKSQPCAHTTPLEPWVRSDGVAVCGVCHPNPNGRQEKSGSHSPETSA